MDVIRIRGARTHNLRGIDLDLPRDRLIVITGLSGSGKSSLAFDTIYAEGQRRYVESLSAYARQFLSVMEKPDVDHIEGLSPAIAIEQKATSHNPRSTVGTVTEIYDYLRVLYARAGVPRCPEHGQELTAQTVSQMVDQVLALPEGTSVLLLAPVVQDRKGEHLETLRPVTLPGLRPCAHRPAAGRARDAAASRRKAAAQHRCRGRSTARAPRRRAASRRVLRDSARAGAGRGTRRPCGRPRPRRARVLEPLRLHGLRLQPGRSRAAPLFLQQPDWRLRHLRRPGRTGILRSGDASWSTRGCRWPVAPCAAGTAATPITSSSSSRSRGISASTSRRRGTSCPRRFSTCCSGAVARKKSSSAISTRAAERRVAAIRGKEFCRTSSGAIARPSPQPYAKSSRGTAARARAWIAAAAASTSPHATCSSRDATCRTSPRCRSRTRAVSSLSSGSKAGAARSRSGWYARSPTASRFSPTSGSIISRSIAARRRSPAAKRSASGSRARSGRVSWASCTSSTSRRSGCTSVTTSGCSTR